MNWCYQLLLGCWAIERKNKNAQSLVSLNIAGIKKEEAITIYSYWSLSNLHVALIVFFFSHTDTWFSDCFQRSLCSLSASVVNTHSHTFSLPPKRKIRKYLCITFRANTLWPNLWPVLDGPCISESLPLVSATWSSEFYFFSPIYPEGQVANVVYCLYTPVFKVSIFQPLFFSQCTPHFHSI